LGHLSRRYVFAFDTIDYGAKMILIIKILQQQRHTCESATFIVRGDKRLLMPYKLIA
jgi:hypothetical protein